MIYSELLNQFKKAEPEFAATIIDYRHWGHTFIVVWTSDQNIYKIKLHDGRFIKQLVLHDDIKNNV